MKIKFVYIYKDNNKIENIEHEWETQSEQNISNHNNLIKV